MKEFWNIIGAIAGVLAVAVALYVFFRDREDKSQRLEVAQVSRTSVVNPELRSPSRQIEILYNGRKVPDYTVFQFRVTNVGGQSIRSADYEQSVAINFAHVSEILWADHTLSDPSGLKVTPTIKGTSVELSNVLLNPKDWVTIEVGTVPQPGKTPTAEPGGRIAGVKKIEFVQVVSSETGFSTSPWLQWFVYVQAGLMAVFTIMSLIRLRG
jgi:hypothetical protein